MLSLVAQGLSNAELAETLRVSLPTAKTHVSRILTKLDARDRTQLVILAYERGSSPRRERPRRARASVSGNDAEVILAHDDSAPPFVHDYRR